VNSRPPSQSSLKFRLGTLSILYVTVFLTRIGFGTILIIFPNRNFLPVDSAILGLILALYPGVEGISALPVGAYVDRSGRRRAFLVGMALISVLTLIIGITNDVPIVSAAHALMGLSAALVTIASLTMITDLTVVENRGVGMGAFDLSNIGGYGVGILLGTIFARVFPERLGNTFLVVAGIFAMATAFVYLFLQEPPHVSKPRQSLQGMYRNLTGDVAAIFPLWFSLTIITGLYFFLPRLASAARGGTPGTSAIANSAGVIAIGLVILGAGSVFFGRLSDKIGRTRTMMLGVGGEIGFLILFPELFQKLIVLPPGESFVTAFQAVGLLGVAGGIFFFLGSALIPTILAYVGDKAAHEHRGSAMGLYSLMLSAGIALGTLLAGIADQLGSSGGDPQAGVQAVFYSGLIIFSGLSLTTGILLRRSRTPPTSTKLPDTSQGKSL
jgi:MFS family permease